MTSTDAHPYLAIDLGGSNTRLGLFQSLDVPDFTLLGNFPTQSSYADQLEQIATLLREQHVGGLVGVGVSVGARVARDGRSMAFGPNFPDYLDQPLAADLEALLGCPVRLGHDTVCGLLSERRFGALREAERAGYLTVSTGTGAAIQLGKGEAALISSIEFGHQVLEDNERLCLCGQVGCLETFTGGRQLELRYGQPIMEFADASFWHVFSSKLALGLLNLALLARLDVVAVSGAIAVENDFLLAMVQEKIDASLKWGRLLLVRADLGVHAPLVGAASLLAVSETTILH
ncbi:MAG TPA: ROK family protein [Ktedonobacteraceae bacterium]|nr:ROK family protein [Ktedonobacteraceae bacterium]